MCALRGCVYVAKGGCSTVVLRISVDKSMLRSQARWRFLAFLAAGHVVIG